MMDYKELIVRITKCRANCEIPRDLCTCNDAISAIETLLTERDAAVEDLRGECHACKHNVGWHNVGKCGTCKYEHAVSLVPYKQRSDNWEWRGPAKGGAQ